MIQMAIAFAFKKISFEQWCQLKKESKQITIGMA